MLVEEPIGAITADFYGHFVEHLGDVVYDGIWVGEGSAIPNERGIRRALVDHLRRLPAGAIRWPGGCFADSYDWRDGIGPAGSRPTRTNFWIDERTMAGRPDGPAKYDPNTFGTDEFIRFCRLAGGAPYIAANLRSLPARDFYQWVEYCNAPAGSLAELRAAAGEQLGRVWGWALHHYSWNVSRGATTDWVEGKGDAVKFTADEWYELLKQGDAMDRLIRDHWAVMGELDRQHRVKLVVDEWGAWHREGTEVAPTHLFGQQSTMRDAALAALTLDTFHRHADKVAMANVAQLVNCLHSLFLAHEDRFLVTPTFHVFELYGAHAGGRSVRTLFSAPRISYARVHETGSIWGLAGSASLKGRELTLTAVNPHVSEPRTAEIAVHGAPVANVRAVTLSADDIHAHNTFEQPDVVRPRETTASPVRGGAVTHVFPPASVTRLSLTL